VEGDLSCPSGHTRTVLLEPEDPKKKRDRVIVIKTDLNVLHDATVTANVTHCYVVIVIRPLAGRVHAFQLNNSHQLGNE
jgi:hypothetical protein